MQARDILIALSIKYEGDWDKIYEAITSKKDCFNDEEKEKLSSSNFKCLTILDEEYPNYLKEIWKPPFVLYYYGDISLINSFENNLAIVGTRKSSTYANGKIEEIVKEISNDIVIVSGGALGIDSVAHNAALSSKKKTICVLGGGIDFIFPKDNVFLFEEIKKKGLLISEYPFKKYPTSLTFPLRNRLVAGFSKAVLVGEAPLRSGTHITINYALDQGKTVMAIPYRPDEDNGVLCNKLIQNGACLVLNGKDVEEFFSYKYFHNS